MGLFRYLFPVALLVSGAVQAAEFSLPEPGVKLNGYINFGKGRGGDCQLTLLSQQEDVYSMLVQAPEFGSKGRVFQLVRVDNQVGGEMLIDRDQQANYRKIGALNRDVKIVISQSPYDSQALDLVYNKGLRLSLLCVTLK